MNTPFESGVAGASTASPNPFFVAAPVSPGWFASVATSTRPLRALVTSDHPAPGAQHLALAGLEPGRVLFAVVPSTQFRLGVPSSYSPHARDQVTWGAA